MKDKVINEAIILGTESVIAYREFLKKQSTFNRFLKQHKGVR